MNAAPALVQTSLIWLTYAVAVAIALLAAAVTTYSWQAARERSPLVSIVTVVSLTALLATVLLLPVDAALVSSTVAPALGEKRDWATPERVAGILVGLKIAYYTLYSLDALLCLLVVPFAYFWYEEYDEIEVEEEGRSVASRAWAALKYTLFFVALVVILFLLGFFVPAAGRIRHDGSTPHYDLDYFRHLLTKNRGEKALTFAIGLLVTVGTLLYVVYAAAGLALFPVSLIKSAPSISALKLSATTATALELNRERQRQINVRYAGRSGGMSPKGRRELDVLQREAVTLERRERLAAEAIGEGRDRLYRAWLRVCAVLRPVKMIGGLILGVLSLLVWASMLITGVDKIMNSLCKGRCGYILAHVGLFQPMNWLFVQTARFFPADYVLFALLIVFLFSSAAYGVASVGIRFLWVRVFRIRKGRTPPQAMLIATVMLALIILALNYAVAIMIAPQYAAYGTQTFCSFPAGAPAASACVDHPDWIVPCSEALDDSRARDVCTPTVMSSLLNRVALTWPFFGAVDFWAQFGFLTVFLLVFVTALIRTPRLNLAELDEEVEADEEEGLLASTGRRFSATWQDITGRAYGSRSDSDEATPSSS